MTVSETDIRNGIIISKVGGTLSMIGSFLIIRDIRRRSRENKDVPLTSLILCELSLADFISAFFAMFIGTWMVPRESGAYLAAGTDASCTMQGFLAYLFYSMSIFSNTTLAIAYCLIVKKGWKDSNIQKRTRQAFLGTPPILSVIIAVIPLFFDAYNFNGIDVCEIAAHPVGCDGADSEIECTRGEEATVTVLIYTAIILVANIIIIAAILVLIQSVLFQERKMDRYAVSSSATRELTKKSASQGLWYSAAFALAWWPWSIGEIIVEITGSIPVALYYIANVTLPLQGLFNAVLYFRPRYKSDRERNRDSIASSISRVLHAPNIPIRSSINSVIRYKTQATNFSSASNVVRDVNIISNNDDENVVVSNKDNHISNDSDA